MSKDQDNSPPRYYVKELDRRGGAPNWTAYERTPHGARAVCLCYDELTAQEIMRLLEDAKREAHRQDDLQA